VSTPDFSGQQAKTGTRDRHRIRAGDPGRVRTDRLDRQGDREAMTNVVGLVLAIGFAIFLVLALVFAEKF
jgi:hypothetical protein